MTDSELAKLGPRETLIHQLTRRKGELLDELCAKDGQLDAACSDAIRALNIALDADRLAARCVGEATLKLLEARLLHDMKCGK